MASFIVLGGIHGATLWFCKHLPGDHLLVDLALGHGVNRAFVELDGIGIGDVLVLVQRAVLARYGALAGLALARDDGGIGGQDERWQRLLRLFDFGGQTAGGAALGTDAFLVLFPEPGEED